MKGAQVLELLATVDVLLMRFSCGMEYPTVTFSNLLPFSL